MEHDRQQRCAACPQTATITCNECTEGVDHDGRPMTPTSYCSDKCQTSDLNAHKAACKAATQRKILYRAGEFVQAHFYDFRRLAFDKVIRKVGTDSAGKVHLYEGQPYGRTQIFARHFADGEIVYEFPEKRFADSEERNAALAWQCGQDATLGMHRMIKQSLADFDLSRDVAMFSFVLNAGVHRVAFHGLRGQLDAEVERTHSAHIVMIDGEGFVLDFAAAQFGHHQTVTPFQTYRAKFIDETIRVTSYGQGLNETETVVDEAHLASANSDKPQLAILIIMKDLHADRRDSVITAWLKYQELTLARLLRLQASVFQDKLALSLEIATQGMQRLLAEMKQKGGYFNYQKATNKPPPGVLRLIGKSATAGGKLAAVKEGEIDVCLAGFEPLFDRKVLEHVASPARGETVAAWVEKFEEITMAVRGVRLDEL